MKQVWIGQCRLQVHMGQRSLWSGETPEGQGSALVMAADATEFSTILSSYSRLKHFDLVELNTIELLTQRFSREGMDLKLVQLAQQLSESEPVMLGLFEASHAGQYQQGHETPPVNAIGKPDVHLDISHTPTAYEVSWKALLDQYAKPLWAIVDGVSWPEIQSLLTEYLPPHACLYSTQDPQSQALAPWLVRLEPDNPLTYIIQTRPQDSHSLILFDSDMSLKALRDHFRLFTLLWTPADANAPIYFRFYDPRVMTDMFSALEPWKQTRFSAPVNAFYVPISPWLRIPEWATLSQPIALTDELDAYQGRLLKLAPCDNLPDNAITGSRSFRINQKEFDQFGYLNTCRQQISLAINLYHHYKDRCSVDEYLRYAALAPKIGAQYGCQSTAQVKTLAQCLVLFGEHFPQAYPEAVYYLNDQQKTAHERIEALWLWAPKGLLLQQLESSQRLQPGHEPKDVPAMEALFSPQIGGEQ